MIHALLLAAALSPAALFAQERAAVGSAWDGIVQITERGTYTAAGTPGVPYVRMSIRATGSRSSPSGKTAGRSKDTTPRDRGRPRMD